MDSDHSSAEYEFRKKSPALAAFISFLLPGTGQMYGRKIGQGIIWLIVTILGYCIWVVPGVVLHICCIVNAYKTIQRYNFDLLKSLSSS